MGPLKNMKALLRPGRIDVQVYVTYCDIEQIKGILKLYLDDYTKNDLDLE